MKYFQSQVTTICCCCHFCWLLWLPSSFYSN